MKQHQNTQSYIDRMKYILLRESAVTAHWLKQSKVHTLWPISEDVLDLTSEERYIVLGTNLPGDLIDDNLALTKTDLFKNILDDIKKLVHNINPEYGYGIYPLNNNICSVLAESRFRTGVFDNIVTFLNPNSDSENLKSLLEIFTKALAIKIQDGLCGFYDLKLIISYNLAKPLLMVVAKKKRVDNLLDCINLLAELDTIGLQQLLFDQNNFCRMRLTDFVASIGRLNLDIFSLNQVGYDDLPRNNDKVRPIESSTRIMEKLVKLYQKFLYGNYSPEDLDLAERIIKVLFNPLTDGMNYEDLNKVHSLINYQGSVDRICRYFNQVSPIPLQTDKRMPQYFKHIHAYNLTRFNVEYITNPNRENFIKHVYQTYMLASPHFYNHWLVKHKTYDEIYYQGSPKELAHLLHKSNYVFERSTVQIIKGYFTTGTVFKQRERVVS